jgi:hypothetical protein
MVSVFFIVRDKLQDTKSIIQLNSPSALSKCCMVYIFIFIKHIIQVNIGDDYQQTLRLALSEIALKYTWLIPIPLIITSLNLS